MAGDLCVRYNVPLRGECAREECDGDRGERSPRLESIDIEMEIERSASSERLICKQKNIILCGATMHKLNAAEKENKTAKTKTETNME